MQLFDFAVLKPDLQRLVRLAPARNLWQVEPRKLGGSTGGCAKIAEQWIGLELDNQGWVFPDRFFQLSFYS